MSSEKKNQSALIEARNLSKSFDGDRVLAVREVSLEVNDGEFLVIMGASGSGKSTLLHLLSTLERPDTGEVYFQGVNSKSIDRLDRFRAANIGFVFQMHFLLPHLDIVDNVSLPLEGLAKCPSRNERVERAVAALESVELGHRLSHRPNELSGGERQRAAIARAIVNQPNVVFADEPTGNVDSKTENHILDLFQKIREEHQTTFVVVTHDAEVADRATRVLSMRDGSLSAQALSFAGKRGLGHEE